MRGSVDGDKKGAHIVNAICRSHSLVIGQVKVNEKTNEIKAIPDLLDMLYIKGCIVTIDAMGCQKAIVEKITDYKADYVLNVKENQESLKSDIIACNPGFESLTLRHFATFRLKMLNYKGTEKVRSIWDSIQIGLDFFSALNYQAFQRF